MRVPVYSSGAKVCFVPCGGIGFVWVRRRGAVREPGTKLTLVDAADGIPIVLEGWETRLTGATLQVLEAG